MSVLLFRVVAFVLSFIALTAPARAQQLDPASTEALTKTQALMANPEERQKYVDGSPGSKIVDDQVRALGGTDRNTESIYGVASQVFEEIVQKAGGDVTKMQELLVKAKNDPKGFYDSLSPESRAAIHGVATQVGSSPTTSRSPASTQ